MIDHNTRINLKREETAIESLDAESKPIIYMIAAIIVAVLLNSAFEAYADYKYSGYIHQNHSQSVSMALKLTLVMVL